MVERSHNEESHDFLFHFSSIKIVSDDVLVAAPMGKGVFMKRKEGEWEGLCGGLPDGAHVNRLIVQDARLFACTNKGLFEYDHGNGLWHDSELAVGCYQYKEIGGRAWAATPYGLWSKQSASWHKMAYSHAMVYDFQLFPEFVVLAVDFGLAIYDRLVGSWAEFSVGQAVTGLGLYQGHILGVTEDGALLHGNKQGKFEQIRFANLFLFSIVTKGPEVYVCSDRGLFRIGYIRNRITLLSVRLGYPVTDIDCSSDSLYMATLFQGIQTMER